MVVMFLIYLSYLVGRFVYFMFRRDLYTDGYQDGIYSSMSRLAKLKYSHDTNTTICFVPEEEYWKDVNDAYKRSVGGETNK